MSHCYGFCDLSKHSQNSSGPQGSNRAYGIAPVGDRFLAFCFDVVLFSPLFSLVLSQLVRKIELHYYTDPGSFEFGVFLGLGFLGVAGLTLLAQSLFLWRWGTTPGKYFFKLRVVNTSNSSEKMSFPQAVLRSLIWILEFLSFGLAFLEILSQKQRRPLHDRAAETMVVTLKMQGDKGPHPFEAHFVRNIMLMFCFMALLWGSLFTAHVYHMASSGEFKKAELEENDRLCSSVSEAVANGQSRMDLAIAQFIAGEVEEECLLTEAEFAFWTGDSVQQSWGYLAKSIFYQYDEKKSNEYLNKVCEVNSVEEPCRLAHALQTENREDIATASSSLTAQILKIRELSGRGDFAQALKSVTELSENSDGFEHYSQKQTVKFLWTLNKKEQAMGAYANTWPFMARQDQADLSAWMCLEEVSDRCENRNYRSCNHLKENLRETDFATATTEAVLGVIGESECKKSHEIPMISFHRILDGNESLRDLVLALSSESDWSEEHRIDTLRHLSFASTGEISRVVQKRAQLALIERTPNSSDIIKMLQALRKSERHDWAWTSMQKKISERAEKASAGHQNKLAQDLRNELKKDLPQLQDSSSAREPASESEP